MLHLIICGTAWNLISKQNSKRDHAKGEIVLTFSCNLINDYYLFTHLQVLPPNILTHFCPPTISNFLKSVLMNRGALGSQLGSSRL